jgi:hypothetical protein
MGNKGSIPFRSTKINKMNITKKMMDTKLLQIAKFEEKYGECTQSRAMKKYCTNKKYRQRVKDFNNASVETIKHYTKYGY